MNVADIVKRTRAEQGLPEKITDLATLAKVAALLTRNGPGCGTRAVQNVPVAGGAHGGVRHHGH